jgi:hypothetical protein
MGIRRPALVAGDTVHLRTNGPGTEHLDEGVLRELADTSLVWVIVFGLILFARRIAPNGIRALAAEAERSPGEMSGRVF